MIPGYIKESIIIIRLYLQKYYTYICLITYSQVIGTWEILFFISTYCVQQSKGLSIPCPTPLAPPIQYQSDRQTNIIIRVYGLSTRLQQQQQQQQQDGKAPTTKVVRIYWKV